MLAAKMATYFFLTLLSMFLYGESDGLAKTSRALSALQSRQVLARTSILQNEPSPSVSKTANKNYPKIVIEYNYRRSGSCFRNHRRVTIEECVDFCRKHSDRCVAINYDLYAFRCDELEAVGTLSADTHYSTVLVKYSDGDDPCDEKYFLPKALHYGYLFESFFGNTANSPKACCQRCIEDPRCVVWHYSTGFNACHLQDIATPLFVLNNYVSGYGVSRSSSGTQGRT